MIAFPQSPPKSSRHDPIRTVRRYFKGDPLYGFGFGLSYSTFQYSSLSVKRTRNGAEISATVKNTSMREVDEVVQLYVVGGPGDEAPIRDLRGFQRIQLGAGESRRVSFTLGSDEIPKSKVEISVGGGQPVGDMPHVKGAL